MSLFNTPPQSICILRLSAIGDVCNTIAAVQAIQQQWPTTQITWITGKLEAELIKDLPNITIIVFDKKQGFKAYREVWSALKGVHFDALLHMQYALRASLLTLGIKATYKLGFDAKRSQDFQHLFTNVKVPSPTTPHVLDGLMAFNHHLGVKAQPPQWALSYSAADDKWAQQHCLQHKRHLIVVPGASKAYKNWTPQGYATTILHAQKLGWQVTLAGSPANVEVELADNILKQLDNNSANAINNLVGKSSLKQMLALLDKAQLVIAPDTGPAHMANAMNTPIIGLYAHHNPRRTGPYQYLDHVVSVYDEAIEAETGKKVSELNWRTRVKDPQAMQRINANDVIAMMNKTIVNLNL